MKNTKEKGIVLIALVVTVIILLMIGMFIYEKAIGENGIIEQSKEAKLITELSSVLLDIESDIVELKQENIDKKLSIVDIFYNLTHKDSETYEIQSATSNYGSIFFDVCRKDDRVGNLRIKFNGDVYIDNYKRGKINISENIQEIDFMNSYWGTSKVSIIDGTPTVDYGNHYVKVQKNNIYGENETKFTSWWVNQFGEVMATAPEFKFLPSGLMDYEISNIPMWFLKFESDEYIETMGNTLINTVGIAKSEFGKVKVEIDIFHYLKDTQLPVRYISEDEFDAEVMTEEDIIEKLNVNGSYIEDAGIIFYPTMPNNDSDNSDFCRYGSFEPEKRIIDTDASEMEQFFLEID